MRVRVALLIAVVSMGFQAGSVFAQVSGSVLAFPGAEGFGAYSVGGRGGTVIKVTNLNDSGPGSFRAALEASGRRIVEFSVSGVINLESPIVVLNGYLTIAGQTSPGGICTAKNEVQIAAPHVIIRHMHFRTGMHGVTATNKGNIHGLLILGNSVGAPYAADNVIIDHCSISWGVDETMSIVYGATNVTIQWCIISEGIVYGKGPGIVHSKGLLISGKDASSPTVSVHHNYIAHNYDRNPMIASSDNPLADGIPQVDFVNNVIYNWQTGNSAFTGSIVKVNFVHNYWRGTGAGIGNSATRNELVRFVEQPDVPQPMLYLEGNLGPRRTSQAMNDWMVYTYYGSFGGSELLLTEGYRARTRWPAPAITTAIASVDMAMAILADVGATKPVRDSVDTRVVRDFAANTGSFVETLTYPNDWPVYDRTLQAPVDADNDGMADAWEVGEGLSSRVNDAALYKTGSAYTNVERYLNFLAGGQLGAPGNVRVR